ncbi:MAG: PilZ domain-containing protein, partial [Myxococcota bacterium]
GRQIVFEGYSETQNLSIGGTFLTSSYLLPVGFPINMEMDTGDGSVLSARGEIIHSAAEHEKDPGMGVIFTEVDAENRERLLRFFVSDRIRKFYQGRFIQEFPHLESVLSLEDVALVINLWEDKEMRLSGLKKKR